MKYIDNPNYSCTSVGNEESTQNNGYLNNNLTAIYLPIALAIFAGIIALSQVRRNIISASRIKWIEMFQETIIEYCLAANTCALVLSTIGSKVKLLPKNLPDHMLLIEKIVQNYYDKYLEASNDMEKMSNKARLLLNNENSEHKKLEAYLFEMKKLFIIDNITKINIEKLQETEENIVKISKLIIKNQWRKSKKLI